MKKFLRRTAINALSLSLTNSIIGSLAYQDVFILLLAAIVLTLMRQFIEPLLGLLLLPFNFLTLGLLRPVPTAISILTAILLLKNISLVSVSLPPSKFLTVSTPTIHLGNLGSFVATVLVFVLMRKLISWLFLPASK